MKNEQDLMTVNVISYLQADFFFFDTEICDWIADLYKYSIDPAGRAKSKRVRRGSGIAWYLSHQLTVEPRNDMQIGVFWLSFYI